MAVLPLKRLLLLFMLLVITSTSPSRAAGVTLITHGFGGGVNDWISAMVKAMPEFTGLEATNFTVYEIYFPQDQGLAAAVKNVGGGNPLRNASAEIIVLLNWSNLAGSVWMGVEANTTQVAEAVATVLCDPSFASDLEGHALAELPLHLIGHSRGGSLVCELARFLGQRGVWVNHLTTLDPHPCNNDGFDGFGELLLCEAVDGSARVYENVVFADNYYQITYFDGIPDGLELLGAFNRYLPVLGDGYFSPHSDVHLWYHGTIDLNTPASDGSASIAEQQRNSWWTGPERAGAKAGFYYSRLGGGNWRSTEQPASVGTSRVVEGLHFWLTSDQAPNRYLITPKSGDWPNLISLELTGTNRVVIGSRATQTVVGVLDTNPISLKHTYQANTEQFALVTVFADPDANPFNRNEILLNEETLPGTGTASVETRLWQASAKPLSPTVFHIGAVIESGSLSRVIYSPELLAVLPSLRLTSRRVATENTVSILVSGRVGRSVVLETTTDLSSWVPVGTNALDSATSFQGHFGLTIPGGTGTGFYRARYE